MRLLTINIIAVFLAGPVFGVSKANFFECSNTDKTIRFSYSSSSKDGRPIAKYTRLTDGAGDRRVEGKGKKEIMSQKTTIGKVISMRDEENTVPDLKSESVSLILPIVNVLAHRDPEKFLTMVVETTHRTSLGGPNLVIGPLSASEYYPVDCEAQRVEF